MRVSLLQLNCNGKIIPITVERKNIKNIRLKVYPEAVVKISSPVFVTDEYLMQFITAHQKWIEDKLNGF